MLLKSLFFAIYVELLKVGLFLCIKKFISQFLILELDFKYFKLL